MDLGIAGRSAIVCGASAGLGRGAASELARNGVKVLIAARSEDRLRRAADEIAGETGGDVRFVVADVTTAEGRAAVLAACPAPDMLINNAGGPPPGNFRDWSRDDWIRALDANMLTPIALIRAVVDGMIGRKFGRIVNITSGSVKSPIPTLGMSNGARAGLTGFVAGLSRQVARHNVTINNLLPGPFLTDRLRSNSAKAAEQSGRSLDEEIAERAKSSPAGRVGDPAEFGEACAFLCAASSGFIVGQNLLLDGGGFNSTMG